MLSEVLLLEPDLSTLALKKVEMSHLATFKLRTTEVVLRPKKKKIKKCQSVW